MLDNAVMSAPAVVVVVVEETFVKFCFVIDLHKTTVKAGAAST